MDEDHSALAARDDNEAEHDETTIAYTRYEWDCPLCGCIHSVEADPSGSVLKCDDCSAKIRIRLTM